MSLWDQIHSDEPTDIYPLVRDPLRSITIGDSFSQWITEALALSAAGMPPNAFSLVFDGHPTLEQSFNVFEIVKLDAAFQIAKDLQEERWPETLLDDGDLNDDFIRFYFAKFEAFPQVIRDVIEGRSNISCNFPMGDLWDVKKLFAENFPRTESEWLEKWLEALQQVETFQTAPPLPLWRDLRLENLLPEVMSSSNALLLPANIQKKDDEIIDAAESHNNPISPV